MSHTAADFNIFGQRPLRESKSNQGAAHANANTVQVRALYSSARHLTCDHCCWKQIRSSGLTACHIYSLTLAHACSGSSDKWSSAVRWSMALWMLPAGVSASAAAGSAALPDCLPTPAPGLLVSAFALVFAPERVLGPCSRMKLPVKHTQYNSTRRSFAVCRDQTASGMISVCTPQTARTDCTGFAAGNTLLCIQEGMAPTHAVDHTPDRIFGAADVQ